MNEKLTHTPESTPEHSQATPERAEDIKSLEKQGEKATEQQQEKLESARRTIESLPEPPAETTGNEAEQHAQPSPGQKSRYKKLAFKQTMQNTQRQLPRASRAFSKVIHQPVIEKTSEVASKTIFRPSLTLGASLGALLGGGIFYGLARYYGFNLSGTEFIFGAAIGAVTGLVWEFFGWVAKKLIRRSTPTT